MAKGIGILLVVAGHALIESGSITRVIYAVHMPLFFFLSGALHKPLAHDSSLKSFFYKHLRTRLVPYLTFALVYLVLTLGLRIANRGEVGAGVIATGVKSIVLGEPIRGLELWFFPCLLVLECIGAMLARLKHAWASWSAVLILAGVGLWAAPWKAVIPSSADVALAALPFWFVGLHSRRRLAQRSASESVFHLGISLALMVLLTGWHVFHLGYYVDMRTSTYGNPALFYANAFAGIMLVLSVAQLLGGNTVLAAIGRAAFVIFPTHGICFILFGIGLHFALGTPIEVNDRSSLLSLFLTCVAVSIGVALLPLLKRHRVAEFLISGRMGRSDQTRSASRFPAATISADRDLQPSGTSSELR